MQAPCLPCVRRAPLGAGHPFHGPACGTRTLASPKPHGGGPRFQSLRTVCRPLATARAGPADTCAARPAPLRAAWLPAPCLSAPAAAMYPAGRFECAPKALQARFGLSKGAVRCGAACVSRERARSWERGGAHTGRPGGGTADGGARNGAQQGKAGGPRGLGWQGYRSSTENNSGQKTWVGQDRHNLDCLIDAYQEGEGWEGWHS